MKKTTRLIAALLAVVMLVPSLLVPGFADSSFSDVSANAWYAEAVDYVLEKGLMNGVGDGKFAPNQSVTRAMFVTVLYRLEGEPNVEQTDAFSDVKADTWYAKAVAWAAEVGVTNGVGGGKFAPNKAISRQDMCTMLARYFEAAKVELAKGEEKTFSDEAKIADYAKDAVALCSSLGLIAGFEDGAFRPTATADRAQLATILMRLDKALNTEEPVVDPSEPDETEPDETEPDETDPTDPSEPAEDPSEPDPTEPSEPDETDPTDPSEPVVDPNAVTFSATADDLSVNVVAPEGALPGNSSMIVSVLSDKQSLDEIAAKVDGKVIAAVDISFHNIAGEIEPGEEVNVSITKAGLNSDGVRVVHIKDDGTVENVNNVTAETNTVRFNAKDFSVYAIIENPQNPDNATLTVEFYNTYMDDSENPTPIATMYVKNSDDGGALDKNGDPIHNVDLIIYDPGMGDGFQLQDGDVFAGWSMKENFDANDHGYTVGEIREYIKTNYTDPNEIEDGAKLKLYAMIVKVYIVTYVDEAGTSVGTHQVKMLKTESTTNPKVDYTVNMAYTPSSTEVHFEGWNIETGSDHVFDTAGASLAGPIQNETAIKIDGDVTFSVNAPEGHWLVYHENGKGATFNAAVFLEKTEVTYIPDPAPTRKGYSFDGWYTIKDGVNTDNIPQDSDKNYLIEDNSEYFEAFTEGSTITKRVDIYAKWKIAESAEYSVVIWQQKISGGTEATDYSYVTSIAKTGTPNTDIDIVVAVGEGNDKYAKIDNTAYQYTGFHLSTFDTGKTIDPAGGTVVNVYYDRNEITIKFYNLEYTLVDSPNWNSDTEYYAEYNGQKYLVDSDGYIYVTPETIDRSKHYYAYLSITYGEQYYEMVYYNDTYGWVVYYNDKYTSINNLTTEDFENGRLKERLNAKETTTSYEYTEFSGTMNTSSTYYIDDNGTWRAVTKSSVRYWYKTSQDGNWIRTSSYSNVWHYTDGSGNTVILGIVRTTAMANGSNNTSDYPVTVYTRTQVTKTTYPIYAAEWADYKSVTGLYGSTLADSNFVWPAEYDWYDEHTGATVGGTHTTFMDSFLPSSGSSLVEFYGIEPTGDNDIHFLKQNADSNGYTEANTVKTTGKGRFFVTDKYTGFVPYEWSNDGETWNRIGELMQIKSTTNSEGETVYEIVTSGGDYYYDTDTTTDGFQPIQQNGELYIRFNRLNYSIRYQDGRFLDGDGTVMQEDKNQNLSTVEDITYGADISGYGATGDHAFVPTKEGFVFAGWYANEECSTEYTFDTMPLGGVVVYALWRQIQYRTYLNPHIPEGVQIDWGNASQSLCFRRPYNGTISAPTGRDELKNYEMVGWFLDEAHTKPFNEDVFRINETNTVHYNNGSDPTDTSPKDYTEYDQSFNVTDEVNKDATANRFWITKKITLHALWRAKLDGAKGINVEYVFDDADRPYVGNTAIAADADTAYYYDQAAALAHSPKQGTYQKDGVEMRFMHWKVMKYENNAWVDSGEIVYPGGEFTIRSALAKVSAVLDDNNEQIGNVYMMRLVAYYDTNEQESPTHITWFANGGTLKESYFTGETWTGWDPIKSSHYTDESGEGWKVTGDSDAEVTWVESARTQINAPIPVVESEALSREGYAFIGWARVPEADHAIKDNNKNVIGYKLDSSLSINNLWLVYHPAIGEEPEYFTLNEEGSADNDKTVTAVAADEHLPYHTLYAVWYNGYYVYHSATGMLEAISMPTDPNTTVSLPAMVTSGNYYGGWFEKCNIFENGVVTAEQKLAAASEVQDVLNGNKKLLYDGTKRFTDGEQNYESMYDENFNKVETRHRIWEASEAGKTAGDQLTPVAGTVYYLREIPQIYFQEKTLFIYDLNTGDVEDMYLISAVDDKNTYESFEFVQDDTSVTTPEGAVADNEFYLCGWFNGGEYNDDAYPFVNGKVTVTFKNDKSDNYVAVRKGNAWYVCDVWPGMYANSCKMVAKNSDTKLFVPANVPVTFTLVSGPDGSVILSYEVGKKVNGTTYKDVTLASSLSYARPVVGGNNGSYDPGTYENYTPAQIFGNNEKVQGYLFIHKIKGVNANTEYRIVPQWTTLDGVTLQGQYVTISIGSRESTPVTSLNPPLRNSNTEASRIRIVQDSVPGETLDEYVIELAPGYVAGLD